MSEVKHIWEKAIQEAKYDIEHREYFLEQCSICGDTRKNYTGKGYGTERHICEFCNSTETTKYPAEGRGDVYLCEDCRSIGSAASADL